MRLIGPIIFLEFTRPLAHNGRNVALAPKLVSLAHHDRPDRLPLPNY